MLRRKDATGFVIFVGESGIWLVIAVQLGVRLGRQVQCRLMLVIRGRVGVRALNVGALNTTWTCVHFGIGQQDGARVAAGYAFAGTFPLSDLFPCRHSFFSVIVIVIIFLRLVSFSRSIFRLIALDFGI